MKYWVYNAAWTLAAPAGIAWLWRNKRHRPLLARLKPVLPLLEKPLWVHACSVGEVNTAKPILAALSARFPETPLLLTVSTASGQALAAQSIPGCAQTWLPFDAPWAVRRFVSRLRPRALVLIETELWPNVLRECRRSGVPVILINGRISEKHYHRYRRLPGFWRAVLQNVCAAGMQTDLYADRLESLGVAKNRIRVTGNTKFDAVVTSVETKVRVRMRAENGFGVDTPLLIFGSTRPGDESLAAACWSGLREEFPLLRLIVAPRHMDRLDEAMAPFGAEPILRRSVIKSGRRPEGERVFFLDTVGELAAFYSIASVAVVGGSWFSGVNGHNPLEPAALGVPTVFGPYMSNFAEPAKTLVASRGAIQVFEPERLVDTLRNLLRDVTEQHCYGTRGRKAVLANCGAVERNVDLVQEVLGGRFPADVAPER